MGADSDIDISAYSEQDKPLKEKDSNEPLLVQGGVKSYRVTSMRWLALVFACMIMQGNYMSYDFPTYLQNQIGQQVFGCPKYSNDKLEQCLSYQSYYPWFYSIYSLPNCVLPLFGGFFVDKIGVRTGLFVFSGILVIGQLFCAMSGLFSGGWSGHPGTVMIFFFIGRFLFSLGGENISVTQSTIVSKWFVGKELAFALGTNISMARLGSVAGGLILPSLYTADGNSLTLPLYFAVIICVVSFLFMIGLVYMDKKADQQEGKDDNKLDPSEQVNLKDIKEFPLLYWLLTISCLFNYICMFIFLQFGNDFLQTEYQDGETQASNMLTLPYLISAALSPFVGLLADKIGRRQWLLLFSTSIMVAAHLMWLFFPTCPKGEPQCSVVWQIIPLVFMGIFYSFYAAIVWPCIPLVLTEKVVGTGFGVTTAVQNMGLFTAPLLVGYIIKSTSGIQGGYLWSQIFFVSIGILCLFLSVWIIIENARTGNRLGLISVDEIEEGDNNKNSRRSKRSRMSKASFHK